MTRNVANAKRMSFGLHMTRICRRIGSPARRQAGMWRDMLSTLDNKDSQGTSYAITRDMQDALFHASPMFSPGVESEVWLRDDNNR